MKFTLYVLLALFIALFKVSPAQNFATNYHPLVHGDTAYKVMVCEHLKKRYLFLMDSISSKSNKEKKKLCNDIFEDRYEMVHGGFDDNDYLWGDSLTSFLNGIIDKL